MLITHSYSTIRIDYKKKGERFDVATIDINFLWIKGSIIGGKKRYKSDPTHPTFEKNSHYMFLI